jgi:Ca2+-transporting ATPase
VHDDAHNRWQQQQAEEPRGQRRTHASPAADARAFKSLAWLAVAFSVLVPLLGWLLSGQPLRQMVLTGLALAFSVIPEELPIIITMVLALGGYRLSKKHAIVKRLQAVETLGAVTVIATDKTGTLTENRMAVSALYPEAAARRILEIGVLCNDAADGSGDPLDVALLQSAKASGISVSTLRDHSLKEEWTFDNTRKRMSVVYERDAGLWVGVKGAPEAVLTQCGARRTESGVRPLVEKDRHDIVVRETKSSPTWCSSDWPAWPIRPDRKSGTPSRPAAPRGFAPS